MQDSSLNKIMSGIAELRLRTGRSLASARLGELLSPLLVPVDGFGAGSCAELAAHIARPSLAPQQARGSRHARPFALVCDSRGRGEVCRDPNTPDSFASTHVVVSRVCRRTTRERARVIASPEDRCLCL